jgi:radical SAM family uncharacterized protein/radical SAM-linked protein
MSCYRDIGSVQKPYQYVGHEENTYAKDFQTARARLCLAFPDAYEIGMANVGMQILYHVINEEPGLLADRVYAPLSDMGTMLKKSGQRLKARESARDLGEFDVIGFTLQYELCYTNVLYMLELAGLPLRAAARTEEMPLVIGGGPCAFNPEPVADFFDAFVIGEGEEVLVEVMRALELAKAAGADRAGRLAAIATVPGVYVPSLFEPEYDGPSGRFLKLVRLAGAPRLIERRIIKDLNQVRYPTKPVTPAIMPIHERVSVEVQRGCTRACRFCQAGYIYRPRRERDPEKILDIVEKSIAATGFTDIGLLSLSSADYGQLHPLMQALMDRYRDKHLAVSLPSTRLEALREEYLDLLKEERRGGFTIAPEAGSQRLRNVINKNFTEEEVVETARKLFRNGWQSVKMYFMIGLPTETDDDVRAIAELANLVIRRTNDIPGRKSVTVSVSNFVPKPHTPFQWHAQITHAEILRKQQLIRATIAHRDKIQFRCHAADNSFAEGILARGDRRVALLLERVYAKGSIFDCWQEKFDVTLWQAAAEEIKTETGIDLVDLGLRGRDLGERLPWHRVHSGLHPKFYKNEYTKAVYGLATEDCSFAACHECGLCNEKNGLKPLLAGRSPTLAARAGDDGNPAPSSPARAASVGDPPAVVFRFQYRKVGAGAFVSTLDLQQMFFRAFRRADITMAYDTGNRPRPRLTMGAALPLGVSSACELMDVALHTTFSPAAVAERVNRYLPDHIQLLTGHVVEKRTPPLTKVVRSVTYRVEWLDLEPYVLDTGDAPRLALRRTIDAINAAERFVIARERQTRDGEKKVSVVNVKDSLEALQCDDEAVSFTMFAPNGQSVSPQVVTDAILEALADRRDTSRAGLINIQKTGFLS